MRDKYGIKVVYKSPQKEQYGYHYKWEKVAFGLICLLRCCWLVAHILVVWFGYKLRFFVWIYNSLLSTVNAFDLSKSVLRQRINWLVFGHLIFGIITWLITK